MKADHKTAAKKAQHFLDVYGHGPEWNLGGAYLEAIDLLQAVEDWVPRDLKAGQRLREILEEI